jgi:uncharacterized protein (TIGR03118 family)
MINAWGIAFISADGGTPFWINDEGTGLSELIDGKGKTFEALPFVTIPGATAGSTGKPTGIVGNATGLFPIPGNTSALFIFDTEEGTIAGWNESSGATATTIVTNPGKVYTGLALADNHLYAANAAAPGSIDVFDSNFNPVTGSGGFSDPNLPTGVTPYNHCHRRQLVCCLLDGDAAGRSGRRVQHRRHADDDFHRPLAQCAMGINAGAQPLRHFQ